MAKMIDKTYVFRSTSNHDEFEVRKFFLLSTKERPFPTASPYVLRQFAREFCLARHWKSCRVETEDGKYAAQWRS